MAAPPQSRRAALLDALLEDGYDDDSARFFVLDAMNEVLGDWECRRRVSGEEPDDV